MVLVERLRCETSEIGLKLQQVFLKSGALLQGYQKGKRRDPLHMAIKKPETEVMTRLIPAWLNLGSVIFLHATLPGMPPSVSLGPLRFRFMLFAPSCSPILYSYLYGWRSKEHRHMRAPRPSNNVGEEGSESASRKWSFLPSHGRAEDLVAGWTLVY